MAAFSKCCRIVSAKVSSPYKIRTALNGLSAGAMSRIRVVRALTIQATRPSGLTTSVQTTP